MISRGVQKFKNYPKFKSKYVKSQNIQMRAIQYIARKRICSIFSLDQVELNVASTKVLIRFEENEHVNLENLK